MDNMTPQRRRAARYRVKDCKALSVTVQRVDDSSAEIDVRLLDLSHAGAKMRIPQRMSAKDVLAVKIESDAPETFIEVDGEVCWVTPATGDDWTLGCSFKPAIPNDTLREFAEAGVIERREHRRERVLQTATAMWELRPGSSPVEITDVSQGGFCLSSPVAATLGERTLLELDTAEEGNTLQITGRIKWQMESPDGHCIGCEFIEPRDFNVLRGLVEKPVNFAALQPPNRSSSLIACLGGLAAAALITCLAFTTLDRKPVAVAATQVEDMLRPVARQEEKDVGLAHKRFVERMDVLGPANVVPDKIPTNIEYAAEPGMSDTVAPRQVVEGRQVGRRNAVPEIDDVPSLSGFRTWTDSTGQYQVEALLLNVAKGTATFKKKNGRVAKVPLGRLSDDDVRLIRRWLKHQGEGQATLGN